MIQLPITKIINLVYWYKNIHFQLINKNIEEFKITSQMDTSIHIAQDLEGVLRMADAQANAPLH